MKRGPHYSFPADVGSPRAHDRRRALFAAPDLQPKVYVSFFSSIHQANTVHFVARASIARSNDVSQSWSTVCASALGKDTVCMPTFFSFSHVKNPFSVEGHGPQVFYAGLGEGSPSKVVGDTKRQRWLWKVRLVHVPKRLYGRLRQSRWSFPSPRGPPRQRPMDGPSCERSWTRLFCCFCCVVCSIFFFVLKQKLNEWARKRFQPVVHRTKRAFCW